MNLRVIKKDIDYVLNEVVSDCLVALQFAKDESKEAIMTIINEAIDLRHDLFQKVNHPDKSNIKSYYKTIYKEMLGKADELFDKLSAVNKK